MAIWLFARGQNPYVVSVHMKRFYHRSGPQGLWLAWLLVHLGCSSGSEPGSDNDEAAAGGSAQASGGSLGSGGAFASGGSVGSGGGIGSGGDAASGGAGLSSGGEFGVGGDAAGTGGAFAAGGTLGTGGDASGAGGDPAGAGGELTGVGGTSGAEFQPCPESGPCKILPLGDSITVGWGTSDYSSYRVELFRQARNENHDITFTGTKLDGPSNVDGATFPRNHEGVASQTIVQIQGRVDAALGEEVPHIVLVHAGTNDVNFSPDGVEERLPVLVDKLLEELPDALIVVSSIIPFPQFSERVSAFNATIPPMIQARADAGEHVIFVDQYAGYPSGSELPDGVHPNSAGYARMADKWYDAIEPYLR